MVSHRLWNFLGTTHFFQRFPENTFDVIVESYIVKMRKPDVKIYQHALCELRKIDETIQPGQVVFLDDIQANVRGAKSVGFHSILVPRKDEHKALDQLRAVVGKSRI